MSSGNSVNNSTDASTDNSTNNGTDASTNNGTQAALMPVLTKAAVATARLQAEVSVTNVVCKHIN